MNNRYSYILFVLLMAFCQRVEAQLDTIPPIDRQLVSAEYFWGADPGPGNGTPLGATDGAIDEVIEQLFASGIALPAGSGPKKFSVRLLNIDGEWGPAFSTVIHEFVPQLVSSTPPVSIDLGEYFFNADPGEGNGIPMIAFDGAFDEAVETVLSSGITVPGPGANLFNVRLKNALDEWGPVFKTVIYSFEPILSDSVPAVTIVQAEYFFNADPGEGNGTPIIAFDGALDEAVENVWASGIALPAGNQSFRFNVRMKSQDGQWGPVFSTVVNAFIPQLSTDIPPFAISMAEYFWDEDPGEGNGNPMVSFDGNFNSETESALQTGVEHPYPCGPHLFNVRLKGLNNEWGLPFRTVVYVEDTLPPIAVCKDTIISLDINGLAVYDSLWIDGGSSDNCSITGYVLDNSLSFDCGDIGDHPRTMTVTDFAGFTDSCSATITVIDGIPPTALCRDTIIYLDAAGTAGLTALEMDGGSTDNCDIDQITLGGATALSFTCADPANNSIELSVTDVNGNSSTCLSNITLLDTIPPTALCREVTAVLNENGEATITPADADNGSSDNCGIANYTIGGAASISLTCSDLAGLSSIELQVTDNAANVSACTFNVVVLDQTPPTSLCTDVTVFLDENGQAYVSADDADNGSFDNCSISTLQLDGEAGLNVTCSDVPGIPNLAFTATDIAGLLSTTCLVNVAVVDTFDRAVDLSASICAGDSIFLAGNYQLAAGVYIDTVGSTANGCDSIHRTTLTVIANQSIALNTGWNLISTYMVAEDMNMEVLFEEIAGSVILVKNGPGAVYLPSLPFNQIGDWDPLQGYQVKMLEDAVLEIGCTALDPANTPIDLPAGWSIVSYLRNSPMDAATAFATITDDIILVKDNVGNVYLPALPFNNIGDLQPGQGYLIKMVVPATLTYPGN